MAVPIGQLQKTLLNIPTQIFRFSSIPVGASGEVVRITPPVGGRVVLTSLFVQSGTESTVRLSRGTTTLVQGTLGGEHLSGPGINSIYWISRSGSQQEVLLDYGEDLVIEKYVGSVVNAIYYSYYISE